MRFGYLGVFRSYGIVERADRGDQWAVGASSRFGVGVQGPRELHREVPVGVWWVQTGVTPLIAKSQHSGQAQRVALIRFDVVSWSTQEFRWCSDHAIDAVLQQIAGQRISGGSGFIDGFGVRGEALDPGQDHVGFHDHFGAFDFAGRWVQRAGYNGLGMDIQANTGTLKRVGTSQVSNVVLLANTLSAVGWKGLFHWG